MKTQAECQTRLQLNKPKTEGVRNYKAGNAQSEKDENESVRSSELASIDRSIFKQHGSIRAIFLSFFRTDVLTICHRGCAGRGRRRGDLHCRRPVVVLLLLLLLSGGRGQHGGADRVRLGFVRAAAAGRRSEAGQSLRHEAGLRGIGGSCCVRRRHRLRVVMVTRRRGRRPAAARRRLALQRICRWGSNRVT